ncbi:MAG: TraB/GumN family protein [Saprospiraceae bacterium]|nr:TraB/GumN family protein [Saprospiraceae bacterium]
MLKNSLLWKLEGKTLPAPSYLFGTMHVRDQRAFQKLERVYEAIGECEGFAAEFHLDDAGSGIDSGVMQLPDGQRISDFFSKKKYQKYRTVLLKSTGLDLAQFEHMLPFMVVNFATERLLQQEMPDPLDQHLWGFAKSAGKSLHGIETFQEQMEVLQKITLEDQLKMLSGLCQNIGRFRQYLLRLTELYEASELQLLYKLVKKNSKGMRHLMLYHRNEVMAERIGALVQEQRVFAAIGAAHLGGGKGVLRLLKQHGIVAKPIQI